MCGNIQYKRDQKRIKFTIFYVETRNSLKTFSEANNLKQDLNIEHMDSHAVSLTF